MIRVLISAFKFADVSLALWSVMRWLLLFLMIASPALGQVDDILQEDLIEAPESVESGRTFVVVLKGDLPFSVTPEAKISKLRDDEGNRVLLIRDAAGTGYTITVRHAIVHPTDEEIEEAPWDDREKFATWLEENRRDVIYRDSRFVKVGGGPDPPDPDPDPEPDDLTDVEKKIRDWAIAVGNDEEVGQVADNYATILSGINAGAYSSLDFPEARSKIVGDVLGLNQQVSSGKPRWKAFSENLTELSKELDAAGELDSVDKIKAFFEEIQTGLEAAL